MGYYAHMSMISSFGELNFFLKKVINPIKSVFTIGSEHCAAFKYFGLNIGQSNSEIKIDQLNNIKSYCNMK